MKTKIIYISQEKKEKISHLSKVKYVTEVKKKGEKREVWLSFPSLDACGWMGRMTGRVGGKVDSGQNGAERDGAGRSRAKRGRGKTWKEGGMLVYSSYRSIM